MFTFKIVWPTDFVNYSVYEGSQYVVCGIVDGTIQLLIDGHNNISLGENARVYVMNEHGATVDKIHNVSKVVPAPTGIPIPEPTRDLWVNPSTGATEERFGF
jgi:hypothetical protein